MWFNEDNTREIFGRLEFDLIVCIHINWATTFWNSITNIISKGTLEDLFIGYHVFWEGETTQLYVFLLLAEDRKWIIKRYINLMTGRLDSILGSMLLVWSPGKWEKNTMNLKSLKHGNNLIAH